MKLSRGAHKLLKLLRWYAARFANVIPSRAKLAANLKVGVATIGRWMKELKTLGLVKVTLYGPNSAEYELSQVLLQQLDAQENDRALIAQRSSNDRAKPSGHYMHLSSNRSRYVPYTEPPRKPPVIENYILPGREKLLAELLAARELQHGAA